MRVTLFIFELFVVSNINGFIFNRKNRDITNAIISASFSPLFDKLINQMSDKPTSFLKEFVIDEESIKIIKENKESEIISTTPSQPLKYSNLQEYENPIYDIISAPISTSKPLIKEASTSNKFYYIIETDPSISNNNMISLKSTKTDTGFIITGEIVIAFLLTAILLELQKLTTIQRKINM